MSSSELSFRGGDHGVGVGVVGQGGLHGKWDDGKLGLKLEFEMCAECWEGAELRGWTLRETLLKTRYSTETFVSIREGSNQEL